MSVSKPIWHKYVPRIAAPSVYPFDGGFIDAAVVYLILDSSHRVIYVGETAALGRRIKEHRADLSHMMHRHKPAYVQIEFGYNDETQRKARERALILQHNPPCNRCL